MNRAALALLLLPACGPAFTVASAAPNVAEDAGETGAASSLLLSEVPDASEASTLSEASVEREASAEREATSFSEATTPTEEASAPEATSPEAGASLPEAAPEASPGPVVLLPFRCVSPSTGYVACDSGGGWTVRFGAGLSCDVSHPATAGCLQGSPCEFLQNGGTPIEGTCEP